MSVTLRALLALLVFGLAACHPIPTGDSRCERVGHDALIHIADSGWRTDCTPGFPPVDNYGNPIRGWADSARKVVWVWPSQALSDQHLHKVLLHEAAHTKGIISERGADGWAYCRMDPVERRHWTIMWIGPLPNC